MIREEILKDIALPVNLARVDLVEHLHPDEGIENDGEVSRWRRTQWLTGAVFNTQNVVALEQEYHDDDQLK